MDQMNMIFTVYQCFLVPEDESLNWEKTLLISRFPEGFIVFSLLSYLTLKYGIMINAIAVTVHKMQDCRNTASRLILN